MSSCAMTSILVELSILPASIGALATLGIIVALLTNAEPCCVIRHPRRGLATME